MTIKRLWRSLLIVTVAFASQQVLASDTGNIVGSLTNTSGSDYTVTVTDQSTGRTRTVSADGSGSFRFSRLPIGEYEVSVAENGTVVARDTAYVSLNSNVPVRFVFDDSIEEIITTAQAISADTYSTDSGLVMNNAQIEILPVARNLTAVSMLAPGTVLGDSRFSLANGSNGYVSFGGSSIAENSCYINGLEVTNTRQGLGCGSVPFEFYKEFQVKTGGYSAQYGRTTGGVLNAVTKSGTNEWEFSTGIQYSPENWYEGGKKSFANDGSGNVFRDTTDDSYGESSLILTAGGPILRDRLFFYGIVEQRDTEQNFSDNTGREAYSPDDEYRKVTAKGSDNLFWGTKIDWDITDNHQLSAFAYSNRSDATDVHFARNPNTGVRSSTSNGSFLRKRGGEAYNFNYTGHFTDNLTVSAMFGNIQTEYVSDPTNTTCPLVTDTRATPTAVGCGPGGNIGENNDDNTQTRFDVEYAIGNHVIRAGIDKQDRQSTRIVEPTGGVSAIVYNTFAPGASIVINNTSTYTNNTGAAQDYVSQRIFVGGGSFSSDLEAYYIEDEWNFNDNFTFYIGARKDKLQNAGTTGLVFVDFDQEWAPRLGLSWDPAGDGESKFYGTWGRYYLPVANNTNYRVAANISDQTTYYTFTGINAADGSPTGIVPITGNQASSTSVNSFVGAPGVPVFQAKEADPFYKEELILGYERSINERYSVGVRLISRDVGATLDDYCGLVSSQWCTLVNPGFKGTWGQDADLNGEADGGILTTYTPEQIGLPKGVNEYTSAQFELESVTDTSNWTLVYTWGRSVGNFEGSVKSDIVQADAGITQDFDFPALMDGAFGYLPNDRRHSFKFYGNYFFTDQLSVGWNATAFSGRPLNKFGAGHPEGDDPAQFGSYGDTYYIFTNTCNEGGAVINCANTALDLNDPAQAAQFQDNKIYVRGARGSAGRTPWNVNLDVSANYNFQLSNVDMTASIKVFNIMDIQESNSQNEAFEQRRSEGTLNQYYGASYAWQAPRHIQLGLTARF